MSKQTGKLIKKEYLTPLDAEKKTLHLEIFSEEPVGYFPGDSIAVDVINPLPYVEKWLKKHNRDPKERVVHRRTQEELDLKTYLLHHISLPSVADGDISRARPLMPRFYSIASSNTLYPDTLHLLVTLDEFSDENGDPLMGVASYFFAHHLSLDDTFQFKLYVNEKFRLPAPEVPILMIGAGTGLAPYKAFLEERISTQASGKNWLIFGDRHKATHFYYASFILDLVNKDQLKLSLAFSRDQKEKIYVQDRLREESDALFSLIDQGGVIYICGDAKVMAKGVTQTLEELYQQRTHTTIVESTQWLRQLKQNGQLLLDIY